ncbi:MAG: DUF1318 domain-containing protein [Candidatus Omnitrophica bacterium]|nr:DUF1318 domain-containing protein [Candidatus Omnitrophota bacterium]
MNRSISNSKEGLAMRHIYTFGLAIALVFLTTLSSGFAADYDFKELTPEIKKALQDRQTRYAQIQDLKKEGAIGENNKGYVTELESNASAASLTEAENRDRRVIYEALARQNKLGNTGLLEVQKAFADVQREKAGPGDMIQSSSGDWKRKA